MTWLVLGMVLTQHARAQTRPPTLRDDMWRNRAIKCVVNPANPAGPKQIGGIVGIAPQVLPPFTSTTWTFRFLNADLQATWTQPGPGQEMRCMLP